MGKSMLCNDDGGRMSKNCRIEFVDGELVCLCPHRNYDNCDLVKAEKQRDEQIAKEQGITLEEYYGDEK